MNIKKVEIRAAQVEDPVSKLHLLSFSGVRQHLTQPFALESAVEHQQLGYSGIVDCVARSVFETTGISPLHKKLFILSYYQVQGPTGVDRLEDCREGEEQG